MEVFSFKMLMSLALIDRASYTIHRGGKTALCFSM